MQNNAPRAVGNAGGSETRPYKPISSVNITVSAQKNGPTEACVAPRFCPRCLQSQNDIENFPMAQAEKLARLA
jgi:hypothetical protein